MHTPTRPVAAANPCAACPAPCSWRTRMCRIEESINGSYAGRMAPPGMPKMCSTPAASSDWTRLFAPVICSLILLVPHLLAAGTAAAERTVPNKKPLGRKATRGDARAERRCSAHASRAYKNVLAHGEKVAPSAGRRHPAGARVPAYGQRVHVTDARRWQSGGQAVAKR